MGDVKKTMPSPAEMAPKPKSTKKKYRYKDPNVKPLFRDEESFDAYCRMGEKRTINGLHKILSSFEGRTSPQATTLKMWSRKYNWAARCQVYDFEVSRQVSDEMTGKLIAHHAESMASISAKYSRGASLLADKLINSVATLKIKSGADARAVSDAMVSLTKAAEVLNGGVSDRTERVTNTVEERKTAAQAIVSDAFKKFTQSTGQDNAKRTARPDGTERAVGDAANARTGTAGI